MKGRLSIAIGLVLILLGTVMLADRLGYLAGKEALTWTLVFASVGIIFLILVLSGREYSWALWPACLFLSLSPFLYVTANGLIPVEEVAVGAFLFCGIALPFWLTLILQGRSAWWAAIPAGILTFIALGIALGPVVGENWTGTLVLWGIAIPFWMIYLLGRERWWALIPAGTMTTVGLLPLVGESWSSGLTLLLLFGGLGLTFLLVYLLPGRRAEVQWALWPAGACILLAVLAPFLEAWYNLLWSILLIGGGVALLVRALSRRQT